MLAFRHDVAILFYGDALVLVAQVRDQFGNGIDLIELHRFAIEGDVHFLKIPLIKDMEMRPARYWPNLTVAARSCISMPGSSKACPAPGPRSNSAWGQAECNAQSVGAGVRRSQHP